MSTAEWIVTILTVYVGIGALFGVAFAVRGAGVLDPVPKSSGWRFRAVLFPGSVALWPLLLKKWLS